MSSGKAFSITDNIIEVAVDAPGEAPNKQVILPSLLLITGEFQTNQLIIPLIGTLVGIALIGIAFSGYWFRPLMKYEQIIIGTGSLFFVAPGMGSMIIGLLMFPVEINETSEEKG